MTFQARAAKRYALPMGPGRGRELGRRAPPLSPTRTRTNPASVSARDRALGLMIARLCVARVSGLNHRIALTTTGWA